MKKYITLFICLLLPAHASATLQVFACEPEWAALSKELAGEAVDVYSATTGLQDPHYIQARPSLIARLRRADLLICTGAGLESGWLPVLLRRASNPQVQPGQVGHFVAADYVNLIGKPTVLDRSKGDVHAEGDPHFITDPRTLLPIAKALSKRLQQIDASQQVSYQQKLKDFEMRWQQAIQDWQKQARVLRGMQVISQHKSWSYLWQWLDVKEVNRLEPKPGIPPGTAYLASVLQQTKTQPIRAIIRANYQDKTPAEWLHTRSNIPVVVLPYTVGGNEQSVDLTSLYNDTINRLLNGMKRQ